MFCADYRGFFHERPLTTVGSFEFALDNSGLWGSSLMYRTIVTLIPSIMASSRNELYGDVSSIDTKPGGKTVYLS